MHKGTYADDCLVKRVTEVCKIVSVLMPMFLPKLLVNYICLLKTLIDFSRCTA